MSFDGSAEEEKEEEWGGVMGRSERPRRKDTSSCRHQDARVHEARSTPYGLALITPLL